MSSLRFHIRLRRHYGKQFQCNICDKMFSNESVKLMHVRMHYGERPHPCEECDQRFSSATYLRTHTHMFKQQRYCFKEDQDEELEDEDDEEEEPTVMPIVKVLIEEDDDMHEPMDGIDYAEMDKFWDDDSHEVYECDSDYDPNRPEPIKPKKPKKPRWNCQHCSFTTTLKKELTTHVASAHVKLWRLHRCTECPETFRSQTKRVQHTKEVHNKQALFTCTNCTMSFGSGNSLRKHRISVHERAKFPCVFCSGEFSRSSELLTHIRVMHTQAKKMFPCELCDKSFSSDDNLKKHVLRVHAKLKNFWCAECGKGFTLKATLTKHLLVHTGVKKLACHYCEKMFYNQSNLEAHEVRNHTRKFPHVCADCGRGYMRPGQLKKHYELKHLIGVEEV